jgi:hypothetical protein
MPTMRGRRMPARRRRMLKRRRRRSAMHSRIRIVKCRTMSTSPGPRSSTMPRMAMTPPRTMTIPTIPSTPSALESYHPRVK